MDSVPELEKRRAAVLAQISQLGDFRPGSITSTQGRCGNPNCHCHKPGEPGHGPNLRLTYKVGGKTLTESFATPAAQRKAQREVAEFRRYQELSRDLDRGECADLPGTPGGGHSLRRGKKTAEAIHQEITREVEQLLRAIFTGRRKTGRLDLEAVEMAVRSAMHRAGAAALTELLQFPVPAAGQRTVDCGCGRQARFQELRSKADPDRRGSVHISRPYYLVRSCHTGQFPTDVEMDIEDTESSPGVRRMQALVGQEAPFDQGRQQMKLLADLEVTAKTVERTAEAIGAISHAANSRRSSGPSSWICRWSLASQCPSCMCKWTGREYRW